MGLAGFEQNGCGATIVFSLGFGPPT
jgi:hypothetical protein